MKKDSDKDPIQRGPSFNSPDSVSALKVVVSCPACRTEFDAGTAIQQVVEEQAGAQVAAKQAELKKKEADLTKGQTDLEAQVLQRLDEERSKLSEAARLAVREDFAVQLEAKEAEVAASRNKLKAAQQRELEFLLKKRELDDQAAELKLALQRQLEVERTAIREAMQAQADQQRRTALADQETQLTALRQAAEAAKVREQALSKKAAELAQAQASLDAKVSQRVEAERAKLTEQAQVAAREEFAAQLGAKEAEAADSRGKLQAAQQRELEVLVQKRKLEDDTAALNLTIEQRIGEERERIKLYASTQVKEQMELKLREKELLMQGMREQMENMKRKMDQGSQQAQGEAQELLLEDQLRWAFPTDIIQGVGKGLEGADILQIVRDPQGRECGSILWESKRTKTWVDGWVPKLLIDRARENATIAALATQALPKGITSIGQRDDVWVCGFPFAVPMAMLLRQGLIETSMARESMKNKQDKQSILYSYLTGPEFRGRLSSVVYVGGQLLGNLSDERKAMGKLWTERERLLWVAMAGIQGIQSDLQTIAGSDIMVLPPSDEGIRTLQSLSNSIPSAMPEVADSLIPDSGDVTGDGAREKKDAIFLSSLAQMGGKARNTALRAALGETEADYHETQQRLVSRKLIVGGSGPRGTVRLKGKAA